MALDTTLYRRAFADVCRGYSLGRTKDGRTVYVRHLSHFEHTDFDLLQARFEEQATANGAPTEKERLVYLYSKGLWSDAKERKIAVQRDFLVRLEEGRKTIPIPSIMRSHEEQIGREKVKLTQMLVTRTHALGITAELHAQRLLEDHYLIHNLFVDNELSVQFLSTDSFDDLDDAQVEIMHDLYRAATEPCSDANLRKLAIQDFFSSYWTLCADNAQVFFGRAVSELTYYQVRLANYARYMKILVENTDMSQLTPEQRADPDIIESKNITQRNAAKLTMEGKTPNVGLTSQDLKESNGQFSTPPPPGLSGVELVKWLTRNQR